MTATAANHVFMLPDLGEGLTEAEIVDWRVALGDTVELDQVVVEVETAKAVVEVPCPYAGRVVALHGAPGETRPVGQPLITVEPVTGASVAAGGPAAAAGPADPVAQATYREEERAGSGNVLIGYGTRHGQASRRRRRVAASHASGDQEPAVIAPAAQTPADPATLTRRSASAPLVISPLVRRLARERGVDVTAIRGTGPGGIVRRSDVEAALVRAAHVGSPAKGAVPALPSFLAGASPPRSPGKGAVPAEPALPSSLVGASVDEVVIPLRGVRRVIADKLSRSRREIPEVTIWVDVDATGLMETRATINAARPDRPVSVLALLARICVHALQRFPELNARVDLEREQIIQSSRVNLGVAAQTDRGLVVPVIQDAQRLNTADLAAA
ncbi:MAG TPA: dihydrolipoamide acetyltransferase family protein, partial [Micromonosporaceae bacterium]|nr:dihydrolipoamide acetyltransferase family protein [Micromonosporaceae bacterium]